MIANDSLGHEDKLVFDLNLTEEITMPDEIHSYSELQHQIHEDLRVQHPEWVQPNGDCPTCDSYESRLSELLGLTQCSNGGEDATITLPRPRGRLLKT